LSVKEKTGGRFGKLSFLSTQWLVNWGKFLFSLTSGETSPDLDKLKYVINLT
jgi:hypothetical protein